MEQLQQTEGIVVNIADVNEAPVITTTTASDYDENQDYSTNPIFVANATDEDRCTITYSLGTSKDEAFLTIDSTSGEVSLLADADYEDKSSYTFDVQQMMVMDYCLILRRFLLILQILMKHR